MYIGNVQQQKQCHFKVLSLSSHFYDKTDAAVRRFRRALPLIEDCHRKLWPGMNVPACSESNLSVQQAQGGQKAEALTVPTTVVLASIMWFFGHRKRNRRLRMKTYELLRAIVDRACQLAWKPEALLFDLQGNAWWQEVSLDRRGTSQDFWTPEYRDQRVAFAWSTDMAADYAPWISSTATRPHLADYLAFALDQASSLQVHPKLRRTKQELERSALSILSHLAVFMDAHMAEFTSSLQNLRLHTKRQRLDTDSKWQFVASALDRLVNAEARSYHCSCLFVRVQLAVSDWKS